jgi:hypothetical protein
MVEVWYQFTPNPRRTEIMAGPQREARSLAAEKLDDNKGST